MYQLKEEIKTNAIEQMGKKEYAISKASWLIEFNRNYPEEKTRIMRQFNIIIDFLDENNLLISKEATLDKENDNDLVLHTSNLTDKGRKLIDLYYDKWLKGFDRGKDPSDLKIFIKGLKKIEENNIN
jgi:predicted transcriptional regulator